MAQKGQPRERLWTAGDIDRLRDYAERGFRSWEAGRCLDRTQRSIEAMARRHRISFHGPKGAPKGNNNRRLGELRKRVQKEVDRVDRMYGIVSEAVTTIEAHKSNEPVTQQGIK